MEATPSTATQTAFADFDKQGTTDGSWAGKMRQRQAEQQHYAEKLDQALIQANNRLKQTNTKVQILKEGKTLQLRATLPLKPGHQDRRGTGTKQYKISLGIPANLEGIKTVEQEANELGKLISRQMFVWNEKYLGKQASPSEPQNIGQLLGEFEAKYFATRKRDRKSESTFINYLNPLKKYFPQELLISEENIIQILQVIPSESSKRASKQAISALLTAFDLNIEFLRKIKTFEEKRQRNIPEDEVILDGYKKFAEYALNKKTSGKPQDIDNWLMWRFCYGMIAVFGLRPQEIIINPNIEWWQSPSNKYQTWKVDKNCKTSQRECLPLYPEWIEIFDLKNPRYLKMLQEYSQDKNTQVKVKSAVKSLGRFFHKIGLNFVAYDLRHAWAIRAHLIGIPIKAAADNLGHSVQIHTQIYQRWFSLENRKKAIDEAQTKQGKIEHLESRILQLELENQRLKLELERSRLQVQLGSNS
jgi:integrase